MKIRKLEVNYTKNGFNKILQARSSNSLSHIFSYLLNQFSIFRMQYLENKRIDRINN